MKTYTAKPAEVERKWYIVDAADKPLGRVATEIARILRGKHKPTFTPHVDCGDHVIVLNAEKVALTGRKLQDKIYYRHTGYPGGIKKVTAGELRSKHPDRMIKQAVWGMLPKHSLGRKMIKKLRICEGGEHPHQAQQPLIWGS